MNPTKMFNKDEQLNSNKTDSELSRFVSKLQQQESENCDLLDVYEETLPDMMRAVEEINQKEVPIHIIHSKKLLENHDKALDGIYMESCGKDLHYKNSKKSYESTLELCKDEDISISTKSTKTTADAHSYSLNKDGRKILIAKRSSSKNKTKNCPNTQCESYTQGLQGMKNTLQEMENTVQEMKNIQQEMKNTNKVKSDFDLDYRVPVKRMRRSTNKAISISKYYEKLMDFTGPEEDKTGSDESAFIEEETECVSTMEYNNLVIINMIRKKYKEINELHNKIKALEQRMEPLTSCQ